MKTFTIDTDNNISAFATQQEAAASTTAPFESFSSQKELTQLAGAWPGERLAAIWNSLPGVTPGVTPGKGFKIAEAGASKIWESIQGLGAAAEPAKPKADQKPAGAAKAAKGAPAKIIWVPAVGGGTFRIPVRSASIRLRDDMKPGEVVRES